MEPDRAPLVWLFDVDGTLLLTKGAGREAMVLALRDEHGIEDDLTSIPFAGRTDRLILADVAEKHGLTIDDAASARFWDRMAAHMRVLMDPPRGHLLPGVRDLLDAVDAEPHWVPALLTGNVTGMAHLKLASFGIHERFAWGAFGEEAPDRDEVARLAVRRAEELHGVGPERCVVVGDTEHDIACARAAGAHVIAVTTGGRSREHLESCGADLVLDDLSATHAVCEWARALA